MKKRYNSYYLALSVMLALGALALSVFATIFVPYVDNAYYWRGIVTKIFTLVVFSFLCWSYSFYVRFK